MTHRQRVAILCVSTFGLVMWWVPVIVGNLPAWSMGGPIFGTVLLLWAWLKVRRESR